MVRADLADHEGADEDHRGGAELGVDVDHHLLVAREEPLGHRAHAHLVDREEVARDALDLAHAPGHGAVHPVVVAGREIHDEVTPALVGARGRGVVEQRGGAS